MKEKKERKEVAYSGRRYRKERERKDVSNKGIKRKRCNVEEKKGKQQLRIKEIKGR